MKKHRAGPSYEKTGAGQPVLYLDRSSLRAHKLLCLTRRVRRVRTNRRTNIAAIGCPVDRRIQRPLVGVTNGYCCGQQHQGNYHDAHDFHVVPPRRKRLSRESSNPGGMVLLMMSEVMILEITSANWTKKLSQFETACTNLNFAEIRKMYK